MQRQTRQQTLDVTTGKRSSKGNPVKFNRDDLVITDCNVTRSNYGTASKPKFPLTESWSTVLLPALDALVKPGGPCDGAIVVHQEDNAGPHIDKQGIQNMVTGAIRLEGVEARTSGPSGPVYQRARLADVPCNE